MIIPSSPRLCAGVPDNVPRGRPLRTWRLGAVVLAATLAVACGQGTREADPRSGTDGAAASNPTPSPVTPSATPVSARPRIVILGDSLTAGYGLANPDDAFPAVLQRRVDAAGLSFEVVNMGVSGDTTAGGVRRLDWALEGDDVRVVVVALGGNDGLRGLGVDQAKENLAAIVDRARARHADVLLCGMEAPPNLGRDYTARFREMYRELAREKHVTLLPFLLQGVAGVADLNQADGIHPNPAGALRVADLVWARLRPMIDPKTS